MDIEIEKVPGGVQIIYDKCMAWSVGPIQGWLTYNFIGWKQGETPYKIHTSTESRYITIREHLEKMGIVKCALLDRDSLVTVITGIMVTHTGGMSCRLCQEFYHFAVPNRPDGKTMICYSCRQGWIPPGM